MNTRTTLGLQTHPGEKATVEGETRSQRLKAATAEAHDALDKRIMAMQPFASRESYARFLRMQYRFHRDLAALYANHDLAGMILDLSERNRMQSVTADLLDLNIPPPDAEENGLAANPEWPGGLGWLYVAEGSKLGAAILFKLAAGLGLDEGFGARHLAAHPKGRARHWREFTVVLDSVPLSPSQEQHVIAGARAAFDRARAHVEREFGTAPR